MQALEELDLSPAQERKTTTKTDEHAEDITDVSEKPEQGHGKRENVFFSFSEKPEQGHGKNENVFFSPFLSVFIYYQHGSSSSCLW